MQITINRNMKRILAFLLAATMLLVLAACGNNGEPSNTVGPEKSDASAENGTQTTENKILVVYYSASGNTGRVAGFVADELNADTFEIVPAQPYSDADLNWTDRNSRVCREHDDPSLQDIALVSAETPNWSDYDVVLLGYPIWWREAAWVVNSFVKNNDFTGKTVIPFCTSTSSGLGDSGTNLEKMARTGNWLEGQRFNENPSEDSVRGWARGLDLE